MIVICTAISDGPKDRSKKRDGSVVVTLHETDHVAHAIGESYYVFMRNFPTLNPPEVRTAIVPPEMIVREYHSLRTLEDFAGFEHAVLSDQVTEDEEGSDPDLDDLAGFTMFIMDDPIAPSEAKMTEDQMRRMREFFMRNPGIGLG